MKGYEKESFGTTLESPNPFVTEVYTDTEPIAKAALRAGLNAGESLTLASGWDFSHKSHRQAALQKLRKEKPYAVILAFPCGAWSPLHFLNPPLDLSERRAVGEELIQFALEVADLQTKGGRHYFAGESKAFLGLEAAVLATIPSAP